MLMVTLDNLKYPIMDGFSFFSGSGVTTGR